MMEENRSLVPLPDQDVTIIDATDVTVIQGRDYDDALALAGMVADRSSECEVFKTYHTEQCSENTRDRHMNDLACFSTFLAQYSVPVVRTAEDLYCDAYAWRGMSHGVVREFVAWMTKQGYAPGTINGRLFTVRKYCKLAGPVPEGAGVLSAEQLDAILTVKGRNAEEQSKVDKDRERQGIPQRRGHKKAAPLDITTHQALTLKKTSGKQARMQKELTAADALKLGLMIEHAFRVSEVVALNLESFNLNEGIVTFWRPKTHDEEKHKLQDFTRRAAESYLLLCKQEGRTSGPLFIGYREKRITTRAINERVALLGASIGIEGRLSPHDLRHFWTWDAFRNGNQLDRIVKGGGWSNPLMAMRYAKRQGIANEGVKISEE
jgi:site-specific recombinase XerC